MMGTEFSLEVLPRLPAEIARLEDLANNLWYAWNRSVRELFGQLDPGLWDRVGHNPKLFLRRIDERRLREAAEDEAFLSSYSKVLSSYDVYHGHGPRQESAARLADDDLIAYFCAEFGLHESLPIYSGGLGILAGHHCKSASDLRLPLVAVGLLYRAGYFSQQIDGEGNQIATYVESSFDNLPVRAALDDRGGHLTVAVEFPRRRVHAKVWEARVGHVSAYLLDADVGGNAPEDRKITHKLYDGDRETRLEQEVLLGVGGVRALRALGIAPSVWHLNEGHPAFSVLERTRERIGEGLELAAALELVAANTVFTTHTPVPAGHDYFPEEMVEPYLAALFGDKRASVPDLVSLGRATNGGAEFNMTTLALRGSRHHNGVSQLHGAVSQELCAACWPEIPPEENPMGYLTNGVHVATVLAPEWSDLFDRFLGAGWRARLCDAEFWRSVDEIPDHLFWSVRQSVKSSMLRTVKRSLARQYRRNQVSEPHVERLLKYIRPDDPNVLTVGFARRFATYKRATLLANDLEWLKELAADEERPIVFIFCGKAHPADQPGQALLREIHTISNLPEFVGKVLLVEGYDLGLARRLVAGVDVWLNNPVHTMEASGTSGMKAAVNGTINLSVTDGWWAEGFDGTNGWAIRPSPHQEDESRRDAEDARTLYEILQDRVVPAYYTRDAHGYSREWVAMAKRSMASILPRFNMTRVVNEYVERLYRPAALAGRSLAAEACAGARDVAAWKARVRSGWVGVGLRRLDAPVARVHFGERLSMEVAADLNGLRPEDVVVEALIAGGGLPEEPLARGHVPGDSLSAHRSNGEERRAALRFEYAQQLADTEEHKYHLALEPQWCGRIGYRIRMYATHPHLVHPLETGLMVWL